MKHHTYFESPLGRILLVADGAALWRMNFQESDAPEVPPRDSTEGVTPVLAAALRQLDEYFAGTRKVFDLPVAPAGTEWQRRVWQRLAEIPYGVTMSYGAIAQSLGRPTASRAVGAANGRNPIPIVIPCHRVIGGDGSLTGYRGGVRLKTALLALERGGSIPR